MRDVLGLERLDECVASEDIKDACAADIQIDLGIRARAVAAVYRKPPVFAKGPSLYPSTSDVLNVLLTHPTEYEGVWAILFLGPYSELCLRFRILLHSYGLVQVGTGEPRWDGALTEDEPSDDDEQPSDDEPPSQ